MSELDVMNAKGAPVVKGKYLMYKDRPLVREGDTICYGDLTEKYILVMEIMSYTKDGDEELPDQILVQVLESEDQSKIVRQGFHKGLYEAFGYGLIWLEHALAQNEA
ncbi:MAG: hypothetical protein E7645_03185 [Ruminococcaceae bacterium]|nr:hypothetical protein [Oscillospiraceae bacterium]